MAHPIRPGRDGHRPHRTGPADTRRPRQDGETLALLDWQTGCEGRLNFRFETGFQDTGRCEFEFSPDGRHVAVWRSFFHAGPLGVFTVADQREIYRMEEQGYVPTFSPDGKTVVVLRSEDRNAVLW